MSIPAARTLAGDNTAINPEAVLARLEVLEEEGSVAGILD